MKCVDHSIVILNRLVTWTDKGIELEAGPRHVSRKLDVKDPRFLHHWLRNVSRKL